MSKVGSNHNGTFEILGCSMVVSLSRHGRKCAIISPGVVDKFFLA
jgi:hypothetical protein